jgi:hypothetical protein
LVLALVVAVVVVQTTPLKLLAVAVVEAVQAELLDLKTLLLLLVKL